MCSIVVMFKQTLGCSVQVDLSPDVCMFPCTVIVELPRLTVMLL